MFPLLQSPRAPAPAWRVQEQHGRPTCAPACSESAAGRQVLLALLPALRSTLQLPPLEPLLLAARRRGQQSPNPPALPHLLLHLLLLLLLLLPAAPPGVAAVPGLLHKPGI